METVCLMCGDRGFEEKLVYCSECKVYAQHSYCLDRLPVTYDENVTWFCVDCEAKIAKPSSVDKPNEDTQVLRDAANSSGDGV